MSTRVTASNAQPSWHGEGRTVFSYAHPIFWAPFSLVGDGGGAEVQTSRR